MDPVTMGLIAAKAGVDLTRAVASQVRENRAEKKIAALNPDQVSQAERQQRMADVEEEMRESDQGELTPQGLSGIQSGVAQAGQAQAQKLRQALTARQRGAAQRDLDAVSRTRYEGKKDDILRRLQQRQETDLVGQIAEGALITGVPMGVNIALRKAAEDTPIGTSTTYGAGADQYKPGVLPTGGN